MRLLAVVVLYHPGKDLAGNINSYLPQVDRLLLWDNTPGGGKEQLPLSGVTHPERLEYRGCGRNVGIGTALNDAVAYAREHGYTHLRRWTRTVTSCQEFSGIIRLPSGVTGKKSGLFSPSIIL